MNRNFTGGTVDLDELGYGGCWADSRDEKDGGKTIKWSRR